MISSLNSFGGLSAADVLLLFGANSSSLSSSSSSTSASAAQSASTGVFASNANDPASAIKAILAEAQIGTSGGGSASIATAEAAYAGQTVGSNSSPTSRSPDTASADSPNTVQLGSSDPSVSSSADDIFSASYGDAGSLGGLVSSARGSVTSVSSASGTIDEFQFDFSLGNQSLSVNLAVAGIGPLTATDSPTGFVAGDGDYSVTLEAGLNNNEVGMNSQSTIYGLNYTQAQQLAKAFQTVTSLPGETTTNSQFFDPSRDVGWNDSNYSATLASGDGAGFCTSVTYGGPQGYSPAG